LRGHPLFSGLHCRVCGGGISDFVDGGVSAPQQGIFSTREPYDRLMEKHRKKGARGPLPGTCFFDEISFPSLCLKDLQATDKRLLNADSGDNSRGPKK
jgi:hypothetical protein